MWCVVRAKSEQVALQEEAGMAVEDQVQAAVERHVAAACTGHAQELENMRLQMQQALDARQQVSTAYTTPVPCHADEPKLKNNTQQHQQAAHESTCVVSVSQLRFASVSLAPAAARLSPARHQSNWCLMPGASISALPVVLPVS